MDTPASLLERLRQPGQDQAWARFVELYTPLLFHWARRSGCRDAEAADLVQEVFVLLLPRLALFRYEQGGSFRAWLRVVARNCWLNLRRKARLLHSPDAPEVDELPAPAEDDPFWEAEYRQRLVGRAMALMQKDFQPVTWKACWETAVNGRQAAEVARELGMTPGAVYMARSRVLSRLRLELEGLD